MPRVHDDDVGGRIPMRCRPRGPIRTQASLFEGLTKMIQGDPSEACQKRFQPLLDRVNALEPAMQALDDDGLRAKTDELRRAVQGAGATPEFSDAVVCEAFALCREASVRAIGLRPFDCQILGGLVLHSGEIAEMGTGEGKTLVSVAPAFLNALAGRGVHVVTVNDYLARRDAEWVGRVHTFLGLEVGLVQSEGAGTIGGSMSQGLDPEAKRRAYRADITYVTNSELGFDYLRDNLAATKAELVLPDSWANFCIIDEVDSILVDEARTPLIISGDASAPSDKYAKANKVAMALEAGVHYSCDEKRQTAELTEAGYEAVEAVLGVTDLYDPKSQWITFVQNALKAQDLQQRDVHYICKGGEIIIIDEFTGRTMPGRRWGEGLHQAIEAKEGLKIQNETVTLASISYQNFFRTYKKKSGMTGTADTEREELKSIYGLEVSVVPTNRPSQRTDHADVVFRSDTGKWQAVLIEIKRMHKTGRPVLVGTTSVEQSEALASDLDKAGIPYQLLNAKPENVARESEVVAQSGRAGAVTISTNMAGRGTDILLGGNAKFMARLKVREALFPRVVGTEVDPQANPLATSKQQSKKGKKSFVQTKQAIQAEQRSRWTLDESLYPCELSEEDAAALEGGVEAAAAAWGEGTLGELEAADRLARACEEAPGADDGPAEKALRACFAQIASSFAVVTEQEKRRVLELGGLHVVGTERHESRRIDNQLRGRSGRQGDAGSTRFFLSLEDKIFRIFGGDRVKSMMKAFQVEDLPIESSMLTSSLTEAQRKVEAYFYDIRKNLFEYDEVLNIQRDKVYAERRRALGRDLSDQMREYAMLTADDIVNANLPDVTGADDGAEGATIEWNLDGLAAKFKQYCYLLDDLDAAVLAREAGLSSSGGEGGEDVEEVADRLRAYLRARCVDAYEQKKSEVEGVEVGLMAEAEQFFVLTQYDGAWKSHLSSIKFLQQAVGLRGYAQRDPLTEFKLEAYNLFLDMMAQVRRNCIYSVYQFDPAQVVAGKKQQQKAEV